MIVPQFGDERPLIRSSHRTPLVQQVEYTEMIVVNQLNDANIVLEVDLTIFMDKVLCFVFKSFLFKYFLQIDLMESFISIIDEQLLETVALQYFESINIEET